MYQTKSFGTLIRVAALGVALLWSTAAHSAAEQWHQWRGPTRDGQLAQADWPADLSGLKQSWRVELGKGYSGPIVTADRVFVTESVDEKTTGVRALDRATGKELWSRTWQAEGKVPFFAARNGDWVRSTPAFDGETLYVGDMEEVLRALDGATGEERWRVNFPERFGTRIPDFGFASSPMVIGDSLYVQASNSILKLDKKTGETIWRSLKSDADIMASGAFSSPVMAQLHGVEQLIVQTRHKLCGVAPTDGEVLWCHEVPSFRGMNILTPVLWGDAIFTSTYRNHSFLYRIGEGEEGQFAVEEVWTNKSHAYMSSPLVIGDHAFVHLGNGRLDCIDLNSGESRWRTQAMGDYWSMVTDGDRILALNDEGELHLFHADTAAFQPIDSHQVAENSTWGYLAVAGSDLFVRELQAVSGWSWQPGANTPAAEEATNRSTAE